MGRRLEPRWMAVAENMRRPRLRFGILLVVMAGAAFPFSADMLRGLQAWTATPLAAFGIADIFLAQVTLGLGAGAVAALPCAAWEGFSAVSQVAPGLTRRIRWA